MIFFIVLQEINEEPRISIPHISKRRGSKHHTDQVRKIRNITTRESALQYIQQTQTLVALTAQARAPGNYLHFDSDSFKILIDNCASTSITNSMGDFISKPRAATKSIQGISGDTEAPLVGTIAWKIEDDNGRVHTITLPNTYYAPNAPY